MMIDMYRQDIQIKEEERNAGAENEENTCTITVVLMIDISCVHVCRLISMNVARHRTVKSSDYRDSAEEVGHD